MASDAIAKRLEIVEMTVEGLAGLPAQVASLDTRVGSLELQFLQFRQEVHGEFSALRTDVRDEFSALRTEIRAGDEETRAEMRALHEETLDRISLLGEGRALPPHGRSRRKPHVKKR